MTDPVRAAATALVERLNRAIKTTPTMQIHQTAVWKERTELVIALAAPQGEGETITRGQAKRRLSDDVLREIRKWKSVYNGPQVRDELLDALFGPRR